MSCTSPRKIGKELTENQLEFDQLMAVFENDYIYLNDKRRLLRCIQKTYRPHVDTISQTYYKVLFYEQLLNELYDTHIILNTNTPESYRLKAPIYVELRGGKFYVSDVFFTEFQYDLEDNILGAEVVWFNELPFDEVIDGFYTQCQDKRKPEIREWVANKLLMGQYNDARFLGLKLSSGEEFNLDLDKIGFKERPGLLEATRKNNIGVIKVNNSLGNDSLPYHFNLALNELMDTDALILDLRNTPDGGNTGVAEPVMGRFVKQRSAYQKCESKDETYLRYVVPVGETYTKPVYVLVGRWTGSMGEGMAIGFEGMNRGTVVGTEMNRLAGSMIPFRLKNSSFSARISTEKLYHLNGQLREHYVPKQYVRQTTTAEDETLAFVLKKIEEGGK
jgi:carboxyl-terminal processing protease